MCTEHCGGLPGSLVDIYLVRDDIVLCSSSWHMQEETISLGAYSVPSCKSLLWLCKQKGSFHYGSARAVLCSSAQRLPELFLGASASS